MKSFQLNIIITLLLLALTSCMQELSPSVDFNNVSTQKIYNIRGTWNGYYLHGQNRISPGNTASQSFAIDDKSDFFGPVHLEWENAFGKKFTKDFVFKKEELPTYLLWDWQIERLYEEEYRRNKPGILTNKGHVLVQFYFDQDGVVYYTSDHPDIEQITRKYHTQEKEAAKIFYKLTPEQKEALANNKIARAKATKERNEILLKYGYNEYGCTAPPTSISCKTVYGKLTKEQNDRFEKLEKFLKDTQSLKDKFHEENAKKRREENI